MKKILLLGGSAQQVVAIKTAKAMGYVTVLCDYLPDNPGQYEADVYYNVSTTDVEAVYQVALKEKVDGVLAYASDPAAFPAAVVAERLGIPTNPSESVAILGVKHKFRDFLRKHGFACPQIYTFPPSKSLGEVLDAIKDFRFPIVVKPTDSSGSKGVTMLSTPNELSRAIHNADYYSRNKILIIEEFITRGFPFVIGGDIFVWDGKIILYGEMSCLRDKDGKGLIPLGERIPGELNDFQKCRVHEELQRLISLLNIRFGELNIEILLDKEDKVHFLEVGPRAGGNMIPLQLSDAFGVDLVKANVEVAMGNDPKLHIKDISGYYMTYVLHSYMNGVFDGVDFSAEITPYIYRKVLYKVQGDKVESFDGAGKALGIIFFHFDTAEHMNRICERMGELIKVKLKS